MKSVFVRVLHMDPYSTPTANVYIRQVGEGDEWVVLVKDYDDTEAESKPTTKTTALSKARRLAPYLTWAQLREVLL